VRPTDDPPTLELRSALIEPIPDAVPRVGGLYDQLNELHRRDLARSPTTSSTPWCAS
jgi:hypothetical protein